MVSQQKTERLNLNTNPDLLREKVIKPLKPKKCRQCKLLFTPAGALQTLCGYDCAVAYTLKLKEKNNALEARKTRRETKEKLEKLKTRSDWLKEAQIEFNKYIRLRDASLPCISCQRFHIGQGEIPVAHL